jgi:hypothetical protein
VSPLKSGGKTLFLIHVAYIIFPCVHQKACKAYKAYMRLQYD